MRKLINEQSDEIDRLRAIVASYSAVPFRCDDCQKKLSATEIMKEPAMYRTTGLREVTRSDVNSGPSGTTRITVSDTADGVRLSIAASTYGVDLTIEEAEFIADMIGESVARARLGRNRLGKPTSTVRTGVEETST